MKKKVLLEIAKRFSIGKRRVEIVSLMFEPRDLWVGLFWKNTMMGRYLYFCPVPTLVFVTWMETSLDVAIREKHKKWMEAFDEAPRDELLLRRHEKELRALQHEASRRTP